ncbi:MAG: nucleotidyltransferase family protein [Clostridia bacterium]|nr:nucleotidyltransferase family protein [Clostridia bacterium]
MTVKNEYDYLIYLIGSAINDDTPKGNNDLLYESVLNCAKKHYVSGIAYSAVQKILPPPSADVLDKWKSAYYKALHRDVLQDEITNKIARLFTENDIPMMTLQGTKIKRFYPSPEFREMADLDFFIREIDVKKATDLLTENGFTFIKEIDGESSFDKGNLHVELHTDFFGEKNVFYNMVKAKDIISDPFSYKTDKSGDFLLYDIEDSVFYVYFYLHLLKHYQGKGVGIRRIIDIYYIEKEFADKIDRNYTDEKIKMSGLYDDYKKLIALKDYWFNGKKSDCDTLNLAKEVYLAELHGTQQVVIARELNKIEKKSKHFVKTRYLFSRLYMNKQQIYQAYPFCEKHHYPLFLCLIHRFFCIIFSRKHRKNMKNEMKIVGKKKKQTKI